VRAMTMVYVTCEHLLMAVDAARAYVSGDVAYAGTYAVLDFEPINTAAAADTSAFGFSITLDADKDVLIIEDATCAYMQVDASFQRNVALFPAFSTTEPAHLDGAIQRVYAHYMCSSSNSDHAFWSARLEVLPRNEYRPLAISDTVSMRCLSVSPDLPCRLMPALLNTLLPTRRGIVQ